MTDNTRFSSRYYEWILSHSLGIIKLIDCGLTFSQSYLYKFNLLKVESQNQIKSGGGHTPKSPNIE